MFHQGTGLGLSDSHGLVARLGGQITVDTRINQGTTFTVSLPVPEISDIWTSIGLDS
ncbi:ATP-binding protein [candidate division CSSED10-310 bacterium]|uniref:histidine kinase n=1 Tax=candidate division CSSED10-310 bacterium TaxID=2855610 RepID=A0ABV6Z1X3_UNCC1